jgi:hypothetical protein
MLDRLEDSSSSGCRKDRGVPFKPVVGVQQQQQLITMTMIFDQGGSSCGTMENCRNVKNTNKKLRLKGWEHCSGEGRDP